MIHLFFGENSFDIDQRVRALVDGYDGEVEKIDGGELVPEQLPDLLAGVTLFSTKRLIIIKQASQNKLVWTALREWFEKGVENDIVLIDANPDKRTKTYKWLQKNADIVQTKELQPAEAVRWVQTRLETLHGRSLLQGTSVQQVAGLLVEFVGTDQWRLSNEIDKIVLSGEDLSQDLIQKLIEPSLQATSFELLDAALRGDTARMNQLLDVVSRNEEPQMFLGLVASQLYALALVNTGNGRSADAIARQTGVHPFVLNKVRSFANMLSKRKLTELVERLAELDAHMKSRSADPWVQVRSFLTTLGRP